jgi:hypothetical protein
MEKPVARVSLKSTKEEMLKAYNDLVARFQEKSTGLSEKQTEAKKATEASVVEKASAYTVESIIKGLANVNIYVGTQVNADERKWVRTTAAVVLSVSSAAEP